MPANTPIQSSYVRQHLKEMMEDEFIAFCQDHFDEIYINFSDRMSLAAKQNLLIDAYLRKTECQTRMVEALSKAKLAIKEKERAFDLLEIHRFDLQQTVSSCVDRYDTARGPFITTIRSTLPKLILCIRQRIIELLYEHTFHEDDQEPIHLSYKNTLESEKDYLVSAKDFLDGQKILRSYIINDQPTLEGLLTNIFNIFEDPEKHRHIFLIGINQECAPPEHTLQLEEPCFGSTDIRLWIKDINQHYHLPPRVIELWEKVVHHEFHFNGSFNLDRAYRHLKFMSDLLGSDSIDPNDIYSRLEQRQKLYASASHR